MGRDGLLMMNNDDFLREDYRFTADLLRQHMNTDRALFQAVCSNNLNIILAALEKAAGPPTELIPDLWRAIKNARDDASNEASRAARVRVELDGLLRRMKAAGLSDHLPTIEELQTACRETAEPS